jgi:sterol 3beta-glucosyltransferase
MAKHIVMATVGTLGDARPFVALGVGLQRRGHRVTLATHTDYERLITSAGLTFRPIGGSFKKLMESALGRAWIESADSLLRYMKTTREVFEPLGPTWFADAVRAAEGADAVLAHPAVFGAFSSAERAGIPRMAVALMPYLPSAEIDPVFFPNIPPWGWLRKGLGDLSLRGIGGVFLPGVNRARKEIGLPPIESANMSKARVNRGLPWLNLYSPTLLARPTDWPTASWVTGFCFHDDDDAPIPADLEAFLQSSQPPIYVGFGSMTGHDPGALARLTIDAVRRAKQRAVIVTGWGGLEQKMRGDDLLVTDFVPHGRVLPRVSAVVCHGGAGTVAAALRAGRPTQVVAFFGDQNFWGKRVAVVGAGPRPLLRRHLTAERLAAGIVETVSRASYRDGAARVAAAIASEDGVGQAVTRIEAALAASGPRPSAA